MKHSACNRVSNIEVTGVIGREREENCVNRTDCQRRSVTAGIAQNHCSRILRRGYWSAYDSHVRCATSLTSVHVLSTLGTPCSTVRCSIQRLTSEEARHSPDNLTPRSVGSTTGQPVERQLVRTRCRSLLEVKGLQDRTPFWPEYLQDVAHVTAQRIKHCGNSTTPFPRSTHLDRMPHVF